MVEKLSTGYPENTLMGTEPRLDGCSGQGLPAWEKSWDCKKGLNCSPSQEGQNLTLETGPGSEEVMVLWPWCPPFWALGRRRPQTWVRPQMASDVT